jgi:predicted amidophosphoribosyltransferase
LSLTTGSTVIECSRLLKEMGAEFVAVVLAATTDLRNGS